MPYYPGDNAEYLQMLGAGSALAKSLFGDSEQMARAQLRQQQGALYSANAAKTQQEANDLKEASALRGMLPSLMTDGWANDPARSQAVMSHMARLGKDYLPHIGNVTTSIYAAGDPAQVDQNRLANLVVSGGGDYANTQPGFKAADATERRGQDLSYDASIYSSNASAGAQRYSADASAGAQRYSADKLDTRERWKHSNPAYVQTNEGQTTTAHPDVARNLGLPGVVIQGAPKSGADGKVNAPAWTAKEDQDLELGIAKVLGGVTVDNKGNQGIDPALLMAIPAEKMAVAKAEAAKVFQSTKNMQAATDAALASLGYAPGSKYAPADERSFPVKALRALIPFDVIQDTPARITPPKSDAKPAASATIPPPAERIRGQVYDTPRGKMTWTGTGWVPAGPGA